MDRLIVESIKLRFRDRAASIAIAEKALMQSRQIGYRRGEGRALRQLGAVTYADDRVKALQMAFAALEIAEDIGDDYCAAGAFMIEFCFHCDGGNYDQAFVFVKQAYDRACAAGDRATMALALYNMGIHALNRRDFRMAAEYQELCIQTSKGLRDFHFRWWALNGYGHALLELGQATESIRVMRKALQGAKKKNSKEATVYIYGSLATAYNRLGRHEEAVELAKEGIAAANSFNHSSYMDDLYGELGRSYLKLGKYKEAIATFEQGLGLSKTNGNAEGEAKVLLGMAEACAAAKDYKRAYEVQREYATQLDERVRKQSQERIRDLEITHRVELAQAEAKIAREQSDVLKQVNQKLKATLAQKERLQGELQRLASTDELTGTLNRRQLIYEGVREMERFGNVGSDLSVLAIDIDHFKIINDTFGHVAGDQALQLVTEHSKTLLRRGDVIGRVGGEEFVVVLPNTNEKSGLDIAERLRMAIEQIDTSPMLDGRHITVSIGLCTARPDHQSFFEVMNEADKALYVAKRSGRNRVCISDPEQQQAA